MFFGGRDPAEHEEQQRDEDGTRDGAPPDARQGGHRDEEDAPPDEQLAEVVGMTRVAPDA